MFQQIYDFALSVSDFIDWNAPYTPEQESDIYRFRKCKQQQLGDISVDVLNTKFPFFTPAGQLALHGQHSAVDALHHLGASLMDIICAYAYAGNHDKVMECINKIKKQTPKDAQLLYVWAARGYAMANNHNKVKEYKAANSFNEFQQALINEGYALVGNDDKVRESKVIGGAVVRGYAQAGNHQKVEEYVSKASGNWIIDGYVKAGNHKKVEEYRLRKNVSIEAIANIYSATHNASIPLLYQAIDKLIYSGSYATKSLIELMERLKKGQDNYWNPYWMNSGKKLERIVEAINALDERRVSFAQAVKDKNSALYQAINMARIAPITFLGCFAVNQSKSLTSVKESMSKAVFLDI